MGIVASYASDVAHGPLAIYDTSSGEKIIIKTK